MGVEVFNESGCDGVNEDMLIDVAGFALEQLDVSPSAELVITLVDLETIAELHVRWLDLEGPTDVMSFPMDELTPGSGRPDAADPTPVMLGDIVLCPEFALRQAEKAGHKLPHELALLTVHGCLHLLGYDHAVPDEEQKMFALQNTILANWYDKLEAEGTSYGPRPTNAQAFPSASDRVELEKQMAEYDGIWPVGTPVKKDADKKDAD